MKHNGMINNGGVLIYISISILTHHQNKTLIEYDAQKTTAALKRMNLNTHKMLKKALTLQITIKNIYEKNVLVGWQESRPILNS